MMMTKRSRFSCCLCVLLLGVLFAVPAIALAEEQAASTKDHEPSLIERLYTTIQMPDTFLITYSVEHKDDTVALISYGRDSAGRYYIAKDGQEALYVPEDAYYRQVGVDSNTYTLAYIRTEAQAFMAYADGSLLQYATSAELVGTEDVCGRTADIYEVVRDIGVFQYTLCFAIDQQTGICLYITDNSNLMGYELAPITNVTCTQFVTENVILPGTESQSSSVCSASNRPR